MPGSNRASFKLLKANKLKVLKKTVQFTLYIVCECCTLPPHFIVVGLCPVFLAFYITNTPLAN